MAVIIILAIYILDQVSKLSAVRFLSGKDSFPVIDNVFHLTLVYNTGAAFGIFRSRPHLFVVVAIISIILIIYLLSRRPGIFDLTERVSVYFILAGTLGNLTDRLRFGYVIDFLDLRVWPVFNLADSFITVGAVVLCWSILFRRRK